MEFLNFNIRRGTKWEEIISQKPGTIIHFEDGEKCLLLKVMPDQDKIHYIMNGGLHRISREDYSVELGDLISDNMIYAGIEYTEYKINGKMKESMLWGLEAGV